MQMRTCQERVGHRKKGWNQTGKGNRNHYEQIGKGEMHPKTMSARIARIQTNDGGTYLLSALLSSDQGGDSPYIRWTNHSNPEGYNPPPASYFLVVLDG